MIISETEHRVLMARFTKDNWLQLHHLKTDENATFAKIISLSPEDQSKVVEIILAKQRELQEEKK